MKNLLITDNIRTIFFAFLFALLFSVFNAFGFSLDLHQSVFENNTRDIINSLFLLMFPLCYLFLKFLPAITKFADSLKMNIPLIEKLFFKTDKSGFINCFLFIAIMHFPIFLAYYPGVVSYDAGDQVDLLIHGGPEIHPIFHNLTVYGAILLQKVFNSSTGGILIYTLCQAGIMLISYCYCVRVLCKYNAPQIIKLFALLFFAFYPSNQVFPLLMTKDVLFSAFILFFVLFLIECVKDKDKFFENAEKCKLSGLLIFSAFLFRHNAIPSYLLILPILLVYFNKSIKKYRLRINMTFLVPVAAIIIFGFIKGLIGMEPPPYASSLGIPLQQMARVGFLHHDDMPSEDLKTLNLVIKPENMMNYSPISVDHVKIDGPMLRSDYIQNSINENPKRFADIYFKLAKEYPREYVDAFLSNTYGYWYAFGKYKKADVNTYLMTVTTWDYIDDVKTDYYLLNLPLRFAYDRLLNSADFEKNPITHIMFSIGCNTWFVIGALFIILYKRKYRFLIPLAIIYSLFAGVLFGPLALLRYVYQNYLIMPILLAMCFSDCFASESSETEDNIAA